MLKALLFYNKVEKLFHGTFSTICDLLFLPFLAPNKNEDLFFYVYFRFLIILGG